MNINKPVLTVIAAFAFLLLGFAPGGSWNRYVSHEGHYSIEFPGKPSESAREDTSGGHKPYVIHYATWFPSDTEGYLADWIDLRKSYPKDKSIQQMLEESRDGAIRSVNADNVVTTAIVTKGEPYIAFAFTSVAFAGRGRIYIINKYQYSILTLFSRSAGISPDADRFIRSFKYIP